MGGSPHGRAIRGRSGRRDARGAHDGVLKGWCGREDSNFHGLSPTATSTLRVYHFRHDRVAVGGK